jgi:hypothetical protein
LQLNHSSRECKTRPLTLIDVSTSKYSIKQRTGSVKEPERPGTLGSRNLSTNGDPSSGETLKCHHRTKVLSTRVEPLDVYWVLGSRHACGQKDREQ